MNAKRKWDMRTILLALIITIIIIAVIFVVFVPPSGENTTKTVLTVQEVWQNRESYIGKNIAVEGYYYSAYGPSLVPATTVSNPNPTIWINLDETSLNLAKQEAGNIATSDNLKYRVDGVLQKDESPVGANYYIVVDSIKAE